MQLHVCHRKEQTNYLFLGQYCLFVLPILGHRFSNIGKKAYLAILAYRPILPIDQYWKILVTQSRQLPRDTPRAIQPASTYHPIGHMNHAILYSTLVCYTIPCYSMLYCAIQCDLVWQRLSGGHLGSDWNGVRSNGDRGWNSTWTSGLESRGHRG